MEFCFDVTGDCKSNWIPKICVHKFMPLNITPTKGQDENVSYIGQRGDYRPVNSANPICSWFIINLNSNHMSLDQDNKHRSSTHFRGWHLQWLTVAWEHMDTGNLNCLLFKRKKKPTSYPAPYSEPLKNLSLPSLPAFTINSSFRWRNEITCSWNWH